ncbi:MAG: patatin-like phospholipase family protein [Sporolactobacillus sp.]|jgi:NTE family protein|nr:patatin-like phospholipase family protein [Sporolactobacillus sp.]
MRSVGLVLGGGAVRGFAHIGVLKTLEKHHVAISSIAGSSMGGAIGGLYAAGIPPEAIERYITETPKRHLLHLLDVGFPNRGLIGGKGVARIIEELIDQQSAQRRIEDFPIRFRAVSVDLNRGKQVIFARGDLVAALRATTAFPGVFAPVIKQGMMLVDGGVLNNLPVEALDRTGDPLVIAVDVTRGNAEKPARNMVEVAYRSYSLLVAERKHTSLVQADVVIRPDVGDYAAFDFNKIQSCIDAGETAAEKALSGMRCAGQADPMRPAKVLHL